MIDNLEMVRIVVVVVVTCSTGCFIWFQLEEDKATMFQVDRRAGAGAGTGTIIPRGGEQLFHTAD